MAFVWLLSYLHCIVRLLFYWHPIIDCFLKPHIIHHVIKSIYLSALNMPSSYQSSNQYGERPRYDPYYPSEVTFTTSLYNQSSLKSSQQPRYSTSTTGSQQPTTHYINRSGRSYTESSNPSGTSSTSYYNPNSTASTYRHNTGTASSQYQYSSSSTQGNYTPMQRYLYERPSEQPYHAMQSFTEMNGQRGSASSRTNGAGHYYSGSTSAQWGTGNR